MTDDDTYSPAHPKPERRQRKARKRLPAVRAKGKQSYTEAQRARRKAEDTAYRRVTRPEFLISLARRQGRLHRKDDEIPGKDARQRLAHLTVDELPLCEAALSATGCCGNHVATDVHHRKGRGKYLNDETTFLGSCQPCHEYIESNRAWAREQGYLITRHEAVTPRFQDS